jgi:hypothetical protein
MAETVEPLESFKDCWSTFRRQVLRMLAKTPGTPEETAELLKSRDALLLRLRRLKKSEDGESMPAQIGMLLDRLQSYPTFESLSDARVSELERLVKEAEERIGSWLAGMERKTVYQISVAGEDRRERIKRIAWAVGAFVGFTVFLTAAAIQIFLNRSMR